MAAADAGEAGGEAAPAEHVPALLAEELSSGTLSALREFLQERGRAEAAEAAAGARGVVSEDALFSEDWGMSQFWYSDATAGTLAEEVLELSAGGSRPIACIACPSLFRELRRRRPAAAAHLLEFDTRFAAWCGEEAFSFYDYNEPLDVPARLAHAFAVVVADPPYLSDECLRKTAQTMRLLAAGAGAARGLLLTGAVQQARARAWLGMRPCRFRPEHRSKLGNEFRLFTDYPPSPRLGGWEEEEGQEWEEGRAEQEEEGEEERRGNAEM